MTITELEQAIHIWKFLRKFYFAIGFILLLGIAIRFLISSVGIFEFFVLVGILNLVYLPFIVEIKIKNNLLEKRNKEKLKLYAGKSNTSKK